MELGGVSSYLDRVEKQWNHTQKENPTTVSAMNEDFMYGIWQEQKYIDMVNMRKRREDEEVSVSFS
jgi:hypothetical protein